MIWSIRTHESKCKSFLFRIILSINIIPAVTSSLLTVIIRRVLIYALYVIANLCLIDTQIDDNKHTNMYSIHMKTFSWSFEKNRQLIEERGVSFEDIVYFLGHDGFLDDRGYPNRQKYPNQHIFYLNIDGYIYLAPYVENDNEIFIKTIIPSRKATKAYFEGGD